MDEYFPSYLKQNEKNICPKCKNKISIEKKLDFSYLSECNKCSNLSMYPDPYNYYNNNYNRSYHLDNCKCETIYIYRTILTCNECIKCKKCNNKLTYMELNKIKNINDENICIKCYKENNYNITENINY
jgi:hypothetical protein